MPAERRRGSALAALTVIAAECGSTRASLRNALAALDLAEVAGQEDPVLGQRLLALPVTLVEAFGRWRRLDPAAAARAVEQAALGQLSVRGFVAAEKSARPSVDPQRPFDAVFDQLTRVSARYGVVRPSEALAFGMKRLGMPPIGFDGLKLDRALDPYDRLCGLTARAMVDTAHLSQIAELREGGLSGLGGPEADLLLHRERWRNMGSRIPVLGVMEVEAQSVLERYRLEAKARYLKAAAAASLYPAVIVLLPNAQARDATLDLWPALPYDRLGLDPPAANREREREASRPVILHPGRGQGAVVATCPSTMWKDLCHDGVQLGQALARDRPSP